MSLDTYAKGTQCWFTDEKEGWISATLSTKDVAADGKVTLTFVDDNGKVCFIFSFVFFFVHKQKKKIASKHTRLHDLFVFFLSSSMK